MKLIEVYIKREEDFFEKYNKLLISTELLNYLINSVNDSDTNIKVEIHCKLDLDFNKYIKEGLKRELENSYLVKRKTNMMQFSLLLLGLIFIFLSIFLQNNIIWHEVILIVGWVPIWEAIDMELFKDSSERKKRFKINELLKCEIEVKKVR